MAGAAGVVAETGVVAAGTDVVAAGEDEVTVGLAAGVSAGLLQPVIVRRMAVNKTAAGKRTRRKGRSEGR